MNQDLIHSLQRQNRLLKVAIGLGGLVLTVCLFVAADSVRAHFTEIDVERINIISKDGKRELVIANHDRLPGVVSEGKEATDHRHMPGLVFYNEAGDECGGLIWNGKLDEKGKAKSGMHFSMDRFGGDQQLALGHYEGGGFMDTGLNVYDRGLSKDYGPLWQAYQGAKAGPEKDALKKKWEEAGGRQTSRVFVGRTRGKSSAVILADAKGRPRIMILVSPEGQPTLQFLNEEGEVVQSLPQTSPSK